MLSSWLGAHKCHTWIDSQDTRIVASSSLVGRHQFSLCGIWPAGDRHPFLSQCLFESIQMSSWVAPGCQNLCLIQWDFFFGSWYHLISYWLVCIQNRLFLLASCPFLEVVLEYEWLATYLVSMKPNLNDIMAIWVWPSMNQYGMFFVQTSTLPPSMRRKLTKHERYRMQKNKLLTKSVIVLEDICSD